MTNFYRTIIKNVPRIIFYVLKSRRWIKHLDKHSEKDRYALAVEMIKKMNRSGGYETIASGEEKLPKDSGYMLYPNHQGKYDVLGIFYTHKEPCSFVMDEKRSHMLLVREFLGLVEGKTLKLGDPRQTIIVFKQIADEIKNRKRKYILFPEGGYKENNMNKMEPFKAGSFKVAQMARAPIVPVALIDSYKVYNSPHKGPVTTYVYYLDPLYYEDYKGMKTKEITAVVEKRIRAKINEHLQEA